MVVVPAVASDASIELSTDTLPKAARAPRTVVRGTHTYTRSELAALRRLNRVFREIYTVTLPDLTAEQPYILGITSAVRGEGRTTTALGLALAVARDLDVHVLVVELDLEQPALARELHLDKMPGLAEALHHGVSVEDAVCHIKASDIMVMPAGDQIKTVSRLLRSASLREFLLLARSTFELIIVDLPPALASSDVIPLSNLVDGLLMVVRSGVTPLRLVDEALARFAEGKVVGVVLTGHQSKIPSWLRHFL